MWGNDWSNTEGGTNDFGGVADKYGIFGGSGFEAPVAKKMVAEPVEKVKKSKSGSNVRICLLLRIVLSKTRNQFLFFKTKSKHLVIFKNDGQNPKDPWPKRFLNALHIPVLIPFWVSCLGRFLKSFLYHSDGLPEILIRNYLISILVGSVFFVRKVKVKTQHLMPIVWWTQPIYENT